MIAHRLAPRAWGVVLLLTATFPSGCSPPVQTVTEIDSDVQTTSYRELSAKQYLQAVLARYRAAASYRDSGRVRLSYQKHGKSEHQVAPLSLWLDRDTLYVEAYDARLWSDRSAVTAWFLDPASGDADSQVLRTAPIDGRPTLESLLADPILRDRVSAGLAGPPPQLEWLFAAEPMKLLFHEQNRIQFGAPQSIDGRACRSVRVDADGEEYVFFIDERDALIRRVGLPAIEIPNESGQRQRVTLQLEFIEATFAVPSEPPPVESLPANPRFVRRLVPLPIHRSGSDK